MTPDEPLNFDEARTVLVSIRGNVYHCGIDLMIIIEALEMVSENITRHPEMPDRELLRLLDHGGIVAEWAARALYNRTGRNNRPFIISRPDWEHYLAGYHSRLAPHREGKTGQPLF